MRHQGEYLCILPLKAYKVIEKDELISKDNASQSGQSGGDGEFASALEKIQVNIDSSSN